MYIKKLNKTTVPKNITYKKESTRGRNQLYSTLTYSPVVKRNGAYNKVVSFDLNYSYKTVNTTFNSCNYNSEANSIFATGKWYKFKVNESCVHKIDGNFYVNWVFG